MMKLSSSAADSLLGFTNHQIEGESFAVAANKSLL